MGADLKKKITDFHYGKPCLWFYLLFFLPSFFYFLGISIKNFLYRIGVFKEIKTDAYIICVGNLTTGGVGKTPVVIEIANYLSSKGKKVAVLSHGYGGKADFKIVNLIRTFDEILIDDPELSGDEVNLIAKSVSNASVIISSDRVKGARFAVEKLGADTVVMDDGFSNRRIYKDLNLLLIDKEKVFGNGFCLPLGPLREPVWELRRADRIIFADKSVRSSSDKTSDSLPAEITDRYKIPYSLCKMEADKIYNIKTGVRLPRGVKVVAFCGIGRPEQFYASLSCMVSKILARQSYDDHVRYSQDMINDLLAAARSCPLVTTEKDAVKLKNLVGIENIYVLKLKLSLDLDEIF